MVWHGGVEPDVAGQRAVRILGGLVGHPLLALVHGWQATRE